MTLGIEPIDTERLRLDPPHPTGAHETVGVPADAALDRFTGGEPPDRATLRRRHDLQVAGAPDPEEVVLDRVVRRTSDDLAVGIVQATVRGGVADIAWSIGVPHQRQGFATGAADRIAAWLASRRVHRVEAHIHRDHVASQRVAAALALGPTGDVDDDGGLIWSTAAIPRHTD